MRTVEYRVTRGETVLIVTLADWVPEIEHFHHVRRRWARVSRERPDRVERIDDDGRRDWRWAVPGMRASVSTSGTYITEPSVDAVRPETWP